MGKFTEGHLEQIRMMKKEGKTYQEIRAFFKDTYHIKVWDGEISKICKGEERGGPQKRPYTKRRGMQRKMDSECMYTLICKLQHICKPEICKFK